MTPATDPRPPEPEPLPEPFPTPETLPYWEATTRDQLVHLRCAGCGSGSQHPRDTCVGCGSSDLSWEPCSGHARLHSFIIVHRPEPAFIADAPFVLAIVELAEGVRMTTRIVDVEPVPEALELDMPLELCWQPRGAVNLPVFAPAEAS